jgi:hypothetical protein
MQHVVQETASIVRDQEECLFVPRVIVALAAPVVNLHRGCTLVPCHLKYLLCSAVLKTERD